MKVYDIIVETPVNVPAYLAVLRRVTSVADIDKALGYLARLVKSSKFTAKEIAESWVESARHTGLSLEEIVVMGERELRATGVENALIKKALKEIDVIEPGILAKITARGAGGSVSATQWLGNSLESVMKYANLLGLGIPIALCIKNIGLEYAEYQKSEQTEQDYTKFRNSSQYWINKCVGEVAALIVGNWFIAKVVSIPAGWVGLTGAKQLKGFYLGLARTGQIAFTAALMTPDGRDWLAKMFVKDLIMDLPVAVGGRIEFQPIQKVIRDMIGGWTTAGLGWFRDQAQKVYDPAGAAKKAADAKARAAADTAKADAEYQGVTPGWKYDKFGKPAAPVGPDNF